MANQPPTSSRNLTPADEQSFSSLYFGFASNLSPRTIQQRCPGSLYVGLALLHSWKYLITETGFGNIVATQNDDDVVYGSLSFLTAQHEAALDKSEEIPDWHIKTHLKVSMLDDSLSESREIEVMTYIDIKHTTPGMISKEYLNWMRKAITDGRQLGVPQGYFSKYFAPFLPEDESVGSEEKIMMVRTVKHDREDLRYVPADVMKMTGRSKE